MGRGMVQEFGIGEEKPPYVQPTSIDPNALQNALCELNLLGDDPYLRMQAFNIGIVDPFLMDLEYQTLRKLIDDERTPLPEAAFLSAQSQMWIFAVYELLRTWRQRSREMIKWADSGGLAQKRDALALEKGYQHFGKRIRADQINSIIERPERLEDIRRDLKRAHILFARIEYIRISLAKHEVRQKNNSVALRPGYGRINSWCGALDYEIENGKYSLGYINRRNIADEIRALLGGEYVPSDDDIASFDEFLRGPND